MCNYPDVIEERVVRARVAHRCCECWKEIARGDEYELTKGKWDGDWHTFKTCLWCVGWRRVASALSHRLLDEDCIEFGGVAERLRELSEWTQPLFMAPPAALSPEVSP